MSIVIMPNKQEAIKEINSLISLSIKKPGMIIDERLGNQVSYIMTLIEEKEIQQKLNDLINTNSLGNNFDSFYQDKLNKILKELTII